MTTDAENELEKQYKEYKIQFEQWKEKNKNSVGSEAYNNYVHQFENWERDVEKRRKSLREKAERDAQEARLRAEEEEKEQRAQKAREAEAAEAYRLSQQQYLAHHQAAIESEQRQAPVMYQPPIQTYYPHVTEMKQEVFRDVSTISAAAMPQQQPPSHMPVTTPDLWGSSKIPFDAKDPLCLRWGLRAAPPHAKPVLRPKMPVPCWMLIEHLKDRKKILAPHPSLPPPPMFTGPPPPLGHPMGPPPIVQTGVPPPMGPPNLSVPPPMIPPSITGK